MEVSINDYNVDLEYLRNTINTFNQIDRGDKIYYDQNTKVFSLSTTKKVIDFYAGGSGYLSSLAQSISRKYYGQSVNNTITALGDFFQKIKDLSAKLDEIFKQKKFSNEIVKANVETIESIKKSQSVEKLFRLTETYSNKCDIKLPSLNKNILDIQFELNQFAEKMADFNNAVESKFIA